MKRTLAALALTLALAACQKPTPIEPASMKGSSTEDSMQSTAKKLRPPVDETVPATFETATFALG